MHATSGVSAINLPRVAPAIGMTIPPAGEFAMLLENHLTADAVTKTVAKPPEETTPDGVVPEGEKTSIVLGGSGAGAGPSDDPGSTVPIDKPPDENSPMPEIPSSVGTVRAAKTSPLSSNDVTILPTPHTGSVQTLPDGVSPPKAPPPASTSPGVTTPIGTSPHVTTPIQTLPSGGPYVGLLEAVRLLAGAGPSRIQFDVSSLMQLQGDEHS